MAELVPVMGWMETCDVCKCGIELDREYPCNSEVEAIEKNCVNYKERQKND